MSICAFQLNPNSHIPSPKPKPKPKPSPYSPKPPTHQLHLKPPPALHLKSQTPTLTPQYSTLPTPTPPRWVFIGGASLGLAFLFLAADGHHEALAFGPEGPLVEEFWDNMRRYGLYILTVSTGVIYTLLQPIVELLKNPITAILLIIVVVGSGYLVSQVLSAMVGISDFSYSYGY